MGPGGCDFMRLDDVYDGRPEWLRLARRLRITLNLQYIGTTNQKLPDGTFQCAHHHRHSICSFPAERNKLKDIYLAVDASTYARSNQVTSDLLWPSVTLNCP